MTMTTMPRALIRALRASQQLGGGGPASPTALLPATTTTTTTRPFSSSSSSNATATEPTTPAPSLPDPAPGIIEMRQYALHPSGARDYLAATQRSAATRARHLPLLGFFAPELGADLTTVTHFYAYPGGLDERAGRRAGAAADPEWQAYVCESRAHVREQRSQALVEWPSLYKAANGAEGSAAEFAAASGSVGGSSPAASPPGVYEMRTYRLSATASIRKLVRAFEEGLPAKAAAAEKELGPAGGGDGNGGGQQQQPQQQLALFGSVEVGDLDTVVELWRYPSAEACARARRAARLAPEWKRAVSSVAAGVSEFRAQLLTPVLPLSPMR